MHPLVLFFLLLWHGSDYIDTKMLITWSMSLIINVKMILSLFLPEPKGTVEIKRGNVVEVSYVDDGAIINDLPGRYNLRLPYSRPAKDWTSCKALMKDNWESFKNKERSEQAGEATQTRDDSMEHIKPVKQQSNRSLYKKCELIDVTTLIVSMAGPGKDFYNTGITPEQINSDYHALIFSFGVKQKTFEASDQIRFA